MTDFAGSVSHFCLSVVPLLWASLSYLHSNNIALSGLSQESLFRL